MSTVLKDFDTWKSFLGDRVEQAKKIGMSTETIAKLAYEVGDYLEDKVSPQNDENRLLKELWDVGDESEQKALASLMVKLVEKAK